MKVLQINSVCGVGSTGKIAVDLYNVLKEQGHECKIAYGRGEAKNVSLSDTIKIGSKIGVYAHAMLSRLTDKTGFFSKSATKRFIKDIEKYNPDVIHMHNIHGYYINVDLLFKYLAKADKPVIWTLHDCWSFTGHCSHFDYVGCRKWKNCCSSCPQINEYPKSFTDNSKSNFNRKKDLFTSVKNMTIVTPSAWLADFVRESYLGKYPVKVIYNGIDREVFKPTDSDFREKYNLQSKKVILGVANIWSERKGIPELVRLSKLLGDEYRIVVVGNLCGQALPEVFVHIERTASQKELAEAYSAADVFVNPSFEDNFPSVNIEALACGTPVVVYKTGGCPEAADETCGIAVERNAEALAEAIVGLNKYGFTQEACVKRSEFFSKEDRFKEYIVLYGDFK